jgi:hypothetical protein
VSRGGKLDIKRTSIEYGSKQCVGGIRRTRRDAGPFVPDDPTTRRPDDRIRVTRPKALEQTVEFAPEARDDALVKDGMSFNGLVRLYELLRQDRCPSAREVGAATGTTSVVIWDALRNNGDGQADLR